MKPLFLLSLPRAGSTLVQRVLAAHPEIETVSEPWVLLAPLYALRSRGIRAEYWQQTASGALEDFCAELQGGTSGYRAALGRFALELYREAAGEATYFLDKTPRYHAIAQELPEVFADARFIVLWRNPLAILSSLLSTFRASRFEPHLFEFDLFAGMANLARFAARPSQHLESFRYEDLVGSEGEAEWRRMFAFLELDYDPTVLSEFDQVQLRGRYGDPTAAGSDVSAQSLDKWKATLSGPVRSAWCRRWLRWIGRERLSVMGYDLEGLSRELDLVAGGRSAWPDVLHLGSSWASARLRTVALSWPDSVRPRGGMFGR